MINQTCPANQINSRCVGLIVLFAFMSVFITRHYGDDVKVQKEGPVDEIKAIQLAIDEVEKNSFLEGVASYKITAKHTRRDGWAFRFVILPEAPDCEMSVFIEPDGTVRAGR